MDEVFRALADPSRRRLLDSLNARNGQTLRELCAGLDMARQSVSKHLAVLEAANLVTTVRRGREKLHYLNAAPINDDRRALDQPLRPGARPALADLKTALEDTTMEQARVRLHDLHHTTPERLWQALTEPAFTSRYWNTAFDTDWHAGSAMTWENQGVTIADPEQVVLESDPYRRLSYTWHTFTPELAEASASAPTSSPELAREPRSKVSFDIEPVGEKVKLTVVHDGFDAGSLCSTLISGGWPVVLSELKTLLEHDDALVASSGTTR